LEVLPTELSIAIATGIKEVMRDKKELTIKDILFAQNDIPHSVTVYIKSIEEYKHTQSVILICFMELVLEPARENIEVFSRELHTNRYLINLEEELRETQKKLNESYEA